MNRRTTRRTDNAAPTPVRRFDFGGGELLKPVQRGSDGAMLFEGCPVREGILVYRKADGTERRELVTREAVLDSARTLARAPVTLEHPEEGFVSADTAAALTVGDVDGTTELVEDQLGSFAKVKIAVRRKDAIDAIGAGKSELSPGYDVILDETPGEHPTFGRYDARQIGRACNHLAIVDRGRGGPTVRLRVDSSDAVQVDRASSPASTRRTDNEARMNPLLAVLLTTLGVSRLDDEDAAIKAGTAAAKGLKARADSEEEMKEEAEQVKVDFEKVKADYMKAKADLEAAQGEINKIKADLEEMTKAEDARKDAAELADLQGLAKTVGVKLDGLDLPKARLALAKSRVDSLDANASPERLAGIIDAIRAHSTKSRADRWDFGGKAETRTDGDKTDDRFSNPHLDAADAALAGGK